MQAKRIKLDLTPSHARYQVLISHAAMSRSSNGLQLGETQKGCLFKAGCCQMWNQLQYL